MDTLCFIGIENNPYWRNRMSAPNGNIGVMRNTNSRHNPDAKRGRKLERAENHHWRRVGKRTSRKLRRSNDSHRNPESL